MEQVTGHESHWKAKFQEAAKINRGGDMVISSLSFRLLFFSSLSLDINPIWLPLIRNAKFGMQPKIPLVRSSGLQGRRRTIDKTLQGSVYSSSGNLHR
jgi:hypothetical protein